MGRVVAPVLAEDRAVAAMNVLFLKSALAPKAAASFIVSRLEDCAVEIASALTAHPA